MQDIFKSQGISKVRSIRLLDIIVRYIVNSGQMRDGQMRGKEKTPLKKYELKSPFLLFTTPLISI